MPPRDGPNCDRSLLDDKLNVTMDDQWEEVCRLMKLKGCRASGKIFLDMKIFK